MGLEDQVPPDTLTWNVVENGCVETAGSWPCCMPSCTSCTTDQLHHLARRPPPPPRPAMAPSPSPPDLPPATSCPFGGPREPKASHPDPAELRLEYIFETNFVAKLLDLHRCCGMSMGLKNTAIVVDENALAWPTLQ